MKKFDKLQVVVILISLIAIGITAVQVMTMNTDIVDQSANKYQGSADSVLFADSLLKKFRTSNFIASRDISNFNIKKVEQVKKAPEVVKKVETYWVKTGVELYKKDKVAFSMYFDNKATFNINGKNKKFQVGYRLAVGKIIMKQKYKGSNKFTGNTKLGKEFSGKILSLAARYVYIEHFKSNLAIKYKPNQDPTSVSKDLVPPSDTSNQQDNSNNSSGDDEEDSKNGRRRR